jgi:hypothetical protein
VNTNDIITRVTRVFGDDAKVQINDSDIMRWINDAQTELALSNNLFRITANTAIPGGQYTFTLPPNMYTLHAIKWNGVSLRSLSQQEADAYIVNNDDSTQVPSGTPSHYWQWGNTIHLYPYPDSNGTASVYYTRKPIDVTNALDTPEVPVQYHNRLVEYCLMQAYALDDNLYGYQVKKDEFKENTKQMKDMQELQQDYYPSITSSPADCGDYMEGYWVY